LTPPSGQKLWAKLATTIIHVVTFCKYAPLFKKSKGFVFVSGNNF
jgi:hypothetical protein